ncbi:MAG: AsnC family transcriptional regulator, partial [Thermoplasmatales archaeon]
MEKLDLKDRKILYHLDLDSRQSFTQIGKKAGLHKDAVARRVKKLIEKDIIYNFYTYIDLSKLGYTIIRYYFVLQYATPEIKDEIIKDLVQNKFSMFVNTNEGQIDLSAYFGVKNIYEFQREWNKFYRKYRNYFSKTIFSIWCFENMYTYFNLLDENANKRTDKDKVMKFGGGPRIDIDELDNKILKLLAPNSRISTIEIAQELGVTASTISARIKNLKKKGIIVGHKIDINFSKLDLNFYRLDIDLKD